MSDATFIKAAVKPVHYPRLDLPEVAVAGRSNVGKSTLLNQLFQRKSLVKTSAQPGKTQTLNFFTYSGIAYVDLPGYGYAKVSGAVRKAWGPMIETYLKSRETLKLILFLFDMRRTPKEEDVWLIDWAIAHEIPLLLVLTKADKLKKNERVKQTKKILEGFDCENLTYVITSAAKNIGRKELFGLIKTACLS